MKKFSVIFQYLSRYKGKLVVYMIFNVLSIIFGLISLGMLSPFLDILFGAGSPDKHQATLHTNAIGGLKDVLMHGPCGVAYPSASCMEDGVCSK